MNRIRIKLCGMTVLEQLDRLPALGIDFAGLVFYEGSKRFAGKLEARAAELKKLAVPTVGVFVNAGEAAIRARQAQFGLELVQLHGDESPALCRRLRSAVQVIKAFRVKAQADIDRLVAPYADSCDYFLFDTDTPGYGGSGKTFNWELLHEARIGKPFFLSGGIGPAQLESLQQFAHPWWFAADLNSRLETSPGIKDLDLLEAFARRWNGKMNSEQ